MRRSLLTTSRAQTGTSSYDHSIRVEQVRQLYNAMPNMLIISVLVLTALIYLNFDVRPTDLLLGWVAVFSVLFALRASIWILIRRRRTHTLYPDRWFWVFAILAVASGMFWGSGAWVLFQIDSPYQLSLLMFVVAGLGAGGIVALSASWPLSWVYLAVTLGPYAYRFWEVDAPLADATASLIVVYIASMMMMAVQQTRRSMLQIRQRLDQEREAERNIQQQARYRSLVESTSAILWEADGDTFRFDYISPEVETVLGYTPQAFLDEEKFWVNQLHPDDREWVLDYCAGETASRRAHSMDYRMLAADGRVVWIRDAINVIERDDGSVRLVGVMLDTTGEHQAAEQLEYVSALQNLMVEASRRFIQASRPALDRVISSTLESIGRWCEADRAYLIRFTPDLKRFTNTHEWVAAGISAEIENLQDVPSPTIPKMVDELRQRRIVNLPNIDELGDEWQAERELLQGQDIRSLIVVSVFAGDRLIGLIGFDSVRKARTWSPEEASLLQVLGDLAGAAIERAEVEARLRNSEALRMHAESLAGMGSWEWELDGEFFHASDEWRKVAGVGSAPLNPEQVLGLTPEPERERVRRALRVSIETGKPYSIEHRIVRPDTGEARWVKVQAELVRPDGQAPRFRGFAQDITERKRTADELFRLAHYDNLTGLPNRVLAHDRLQQCLRRARRNNRRMAVLFLDLDHFKKVNDTLGHSVGDRLLKDASERLVSALGEPDAVARIGGDEFLILVDEDVSEDGLIDLGNKLLQAFRAPLRLDGREIVLTISVGIAIFPDDGVDTGDLMRNADTAMYHAKREGRDGVQFFTAEMNADVSRQLRLEEALRAAVDGEQLSLVYQPVVRLSDGHIAGAEALVRWSHPELGDVPPDEFIPLAEHVGLIDRIGAFVVDRALSQLQDWHAQGHEELMLSINVSPKQFRDTALAERLLEAMASRAIQGEAVNIEITEGVLLSGAESVHATLNTLRARGVGIVMDDFGTGFSSLSYLRDYPFSALKVDRRFVRDVEHDPADLQLVVSAIRLGQALGMQVIAEGVETRGQIELLKAEGCPMAQGFHFSPPVDAPAFQELLDGTRAEDGAIA